MSTQMMMFRVPPANEKTPGADTNDPEGNQPTCSETMTDQATAMTDLLASATTVQQNDYEARLGVRIQAAKKQLLGNPGRTPTEAYLAQEEHLRDTATRYWHYQGNPIVELQVMGSTMDELRRFKMASKFVDTVEGFVEAVENADNQNPSGVYVHINRLDGDLRARTKIPTPPPSDKFPGWIGLMDGKGTTSGDFSHVTSFFIDFDPVRLSGISSTSEEMLAALRAAKSCYLDLAEALGSDNALAFGMSGNGAQIHVRLEPHLCDSQQMQKEFCGRLSRLLAGLADRYGTPEVEVDQAVKDVKRLAPAWGSWKRKGEHLKDSRPHRITWLATPETLEPITMAQFDALVEEFGAEPQAAVGSPEAKKNKGGSASWKAVYEKIDATDPEVLIDLLGLREGQDGFRCPGCDGTSDHSILKLDSGRWGFKCFKSKCAGEAGGENGNGNGFRGPVAAVQAVLKLDGRGAVHWLCDQFGWDKPKGKTPAEIKLASLKVGDDSWQNDLDRDEKGRVKNTLANLERFLKQDPALAGVIGWCDFSARSHCLRDTPWGTKKGAEWRDTDTTRLRLYLDRVWNTYYGKDSADSVIDAIALDAAYHPVRSYLRSIKWDGVPRLDTWTTTYMGVESTPYTSSAGRYWLLSAVARVMRPGCIAQYALVLEGKQGVNKTQVLKTLATPDWYALCQGDVTDKDTMEALHGKWIVEFGEFASILKSSDADVKNFLTVESDRLRVAYGRRSGNYPRQWVGAATINPEGGYLRDVTGNRRYWPIYCMFADIIGLERDRDQLWAEAVARYDAGEKWHPAPDEEEAHFKAEQDARRDIDAWEGSVAEHVTTILLAAEDPKTAYVTISDVLTDLFLIEKRNQDAKSANRVRRILVAIGWIQDKPRKINGVSQRVYVPQEPQKAQEKAKADKAESDAAPKPVVVRKQSAEEAALEAVVAGFTI